MCRTLQRCCVSVTWGDGRVSYLAEVLCVSYVGRWLCVVRCRGVVCQLRGEMAVCPTLQRCCVSVTWGDGCVSYLAEVLCVSYVGRWLCVVPCRGVVCQLHGEMAVYCTLQECKYSVTSAMYCRCTYASVTWGDGCVLYLARM